MDNRSNAERFAYYEKLWFRVTLFLFTISTVLMIIGGAILKAIIVVPQAILDALEVFVYLYIAYFVFLILRLGKFLFKIRRLEEHVRIGKTVIGILISPGGILFLYLGLLMMALTSCGA